MALPLWAKHLSSCHTVFLGLFKHGLGTSAHAAPTTVLSPHAPGKLPIAHDGAQCPVLHNLPPTLVSGSFGLPQQYHILLYFVIIDSKYNWQNQLILTFLLDFKFLQGLDHDLYTFLYLRASGAQQKQHHFHSTVQYTAIPYNTQQSQIVRSNHLSSSAPHNSLVRAIKQAMISLI